MISTNAEAMKNQRMELSTNNATQAGLTITITLKL